MPRRKPGFFGKVAMAAFYGGRRSNDWISRHCAVATTKATIAPARCANASAASGSRLTRIRPSGLPVARAPCDRRWSPRSPGRWRPLRASAPPSRRGSRSHPRLSRRDRNRAGRALRAPMQVPSMSDSCPGEAIYVRERSAHAGSQLASGSAMKRVVMTGLARVDSLSDGQAGALELETSEGALEVRFTYEDAERLIAALEVARGRIQEDRTRSALPPIAENQKLAASWETAIDPVNQVAVVRAHFQDRTTQDIRIPRGDIAQIAEFLEHALKRMEPGSDMRQ